MICTIQWKETEWKDGSGDTIRIYIYQTVKKIVFCKIENNRKHKDIYNVFQQTQINSIQTATKMILIK